MENTHLSEIFKFIKNKKYEFINKSQICFDLTVFLFLIFHCYIYQTYDKETKLNSNNFYYFIFVFIFILIINDLLNFVTHVLGNLKTSEFNDDQNKRKDLIFLLIIPLTQSIFYFILLTMIKVSNYQWYYFFLKLLFVLTTILKSIMGYLPFKFAVDLCKCVDTWIMTYMLVIVMTDPIYNDDDTLPNAINPTETYLRFLEVGILLLVCNFVFNYENVVEDMEKERMSAVMILGDYDTFRYSALLLHCHYFFPVINGLAYSIRYWLALITYPLCYLIINNFMKKKMNYVKIGMIIFVLLNIIIYFWAFITSCPNEGDWSIYTEKYKSRLLNVTQNNSIDNIGNKTEL